MNEANLGKVYLTESRFVLAESMLRQAVAALASLLLGNSLIGTARARWGRSLLALKQFGPAKTQLILANDLLAAQHNAWPLEIANVRNDLATLALATDSHG